VPSLTFRSSGNYDEIAWIDHFFLATDNGFRRARNENEMLVNFMDLGNNSHVFAKVFLRLANLLPYFPAAGNSHDHKL
jgi:hypothetical protein